MVTRNYVYSTQAAGRSPGAAYIVLWRLRFHWRAVRHEHAHGPAAPPAHLSPDTGRSAQTVAAMPHLVLLIQNGHFRPQLVRRAPCHSVFGLVKFKLLKARLGIRAYLRPRVGTRYPLPASNCHQANANPNNHMK